MFLRVEPSNSLPIYDQIVRQVKFAVARGALLPGHRVPSVRELARELTINANTVARAYQQLQADGVLQTVRGMGLEVTQGAVDPCREERRRLVQGRVREALREARQSGFEVGELRELIELELRGTAERGSGR